MSTVKKCYRCGLQNSWDIKYHAICRACGASFPLCERCTYSWKNAQCPNCKANAPNARWQIIG